MAIPADKYPENVAGPFYVDDQCIDCDACRTVAPAFFRRHDDPSRPPQRRTDDEVELVQTSTALPTGQLSPADVRADLPGRGATASRRQP